MMQRPEPRSPEQVYLALILDTLERIEASVARLVAMQNSAAPKQTPQRRRRPAKQEAD
jgi:hypothetical protein